MAVMTDIEDGAASRRFLDQEVNGKDSIIADYCQTALAAHKTDCFWICYRMHNRMLAKDIVVTTEDKNIDELSFRLCKVAYQCGWWKRFSIYSAVGVKEVEVGQASTYSDTMLSTSLTDVLSWFSKPWWY